MDKDVLKRALTLLRIIICAGLLAFLFKQINAEDLFGAFLQAAARWPWLASGIIMTFMGLFAGAIRWHWILAAQGVYFSIFKTIHIFFVGQFFNAFMLGACGGDVIRAYYVTKGREGRRAEAAMTILFDRAIGLFSAIVLCCLMIPLRAHVFLDNEGPRDTGFLMIVFLLVSLVSISALFRKNVFEHFRFFQWLEDGTRIGPLIRRAYEAFYLYKGHPRLLVLSAALSVLSMAFFTLACCSFGVALDLKVAIADYFALFPVISVLMSAPITPGSLGVRESLFVSLFSAVFVDKTHAILLSLMVYAGGVFWSLFGGLLYIGLGSKIDGPMSSPLDSWKEEDRK